jgi:hypothetical protein
MKLSLLDMTQNILSALNGDEVNSYADTVESLQVAEIIKTSYFNMMSRLDLPEHNELCQLGASTNLSEPVLMFRPEGVSRIDWIKYYNQSSSNTTGESFVHDLNLDITDLTTLDPESPAFGEIIILPAKQFLDRINNFNPNESNVGSFTFTPSSIGTDVTGSFHFNYMNDRPPENCTILQDYYIIFDSYDSSVDSTLQSSKTMCSGWISPRFLMQDTFVPALDDKQFPLLLNEAKSLAFLELKQMGHPKAEQEVKRQMSSLQKFKAVADKPSYFDQLADYGRRGARRV